MPNLKSQKKRLRQDDKRRSRNRIARSSLRSVIKGFRTAAVGDNAEEKQEKFRLAVKKLDQAAAKNLIHKNAAARMKSRLSKLL
ncbi:MULTISPECIES: 30S ribosomal protein S20 [Symmachiella]|uniref:Small ribosomal subunit protein bS20 n=2 Tax=Symmachiella TaxID=2795780 RepID=A0A517ZVJ5_9PLAN|nr:MULTISPECIES: 30S ribosomal protein S20 [Symmachiella]QDT50797.1 30S ribosomal protein S20 [Symmachiella dynata]QDU46456.1 30S ribosomal protein S20 [Symmachiella dynata]TWU14250.1 30S ribosomal protein S20 [Symmachiella macrocystis]